MLVHVVVLFSSLLYSDLDIRFSFCLLFEHSTCEDDQGVERGKENFTERERVILRKCNISMFKEGFFLKHISSFLPMFIQIIKLCF